MDEGHEKTEKAFGLERDSLAFDILVLCVQVAGIVLVGYLFITFVFGLFRLSEDSMNPTLKMGDLVCYYRLDKNYTARDVVVFSREGQLVVSRVVAVGGDTVNIDYQGLIVNGAYQQEAGITDETTQVADGVTFPLTVPEGSVFVLGDNREEAMDSRIVGCIPEEQTLGSVIGLFRWRGL